MGKKKWLAALFAVVLVAGMTAMLPTAAFAAAETVTVANGINFAPDTTLQDIEEAWGEGTATIEANDDGSYKVTLLKNITLKQGAVTPVTFGTYSASADQPMMILDLNGCVLSGKTIVISNYGNLTIADSVGGGKVVYDGGQYLTAVQNAGYTLIINGGSFVCDGASTATNGGAISGAMTTTTIINGGSFHSEQSGALTTYGKLVINGGSISGAYGIVAKQPTKAGDPASSIEIPADSTVVVNADKTAFVVITDGDGEKSEGSIAAQGGTYNAPAVVGRTGEGDVTNHVAITGGSYTADPSGYVKNDNAVAQILPAGSESGLYVVGGTIADKTADAVSGDTITILSGDAVLTGLADGITVKNEGTGSVTVNGDALASGSELVTHTHVLTKVEANAPTCTESGNKAYYTCSCGKWFEDENAATEISDKDSVVIPARHMLSDVAETAATCTAEGVKAHQHCTVCNKDFIDGAEKTADELKIEKLEHDYEEEWTSGTEQHWHVCADCGAKTDEAEHTFEWKIDKEATAAEAGSKHEECTVCGYKRDAVEIPALGDDSSAAADSSAPDTSSAPAASSAADSSAESGTPSTGDAGKAVLWVLTAVLACAAVTVVIRSRRA